MRLPEADDEDDESREQVACIVATGSSRISLCTTISSASSSMLRPLLRPVSRRIPTSPRVTSPSLYSTSSSSTRRRLSTLSTLSIAATVGIAGYTFGALYPPSPISLLYPRPAPPPPTDASSPSSLAYTAALEAELQSLPLLNAHRARSDAEEWYEVRPHATIPEEVRVNKLTSGALRGPGKLALLPLARVRRDESEAVIFVHLGRGLCGHDGIVHGGLLATLLDEALGRNAILNLPAKIGVTATLSLRYRAPTRADQFVVIRTSLASPPTPDAQPSRKCLVKGTIETVDGTLLVEADALFVQPRYAKLLNSRVVAEQVGVPPAAMKEEA
ncbi:4HBT domain-containing protein [Mycena kentingensis (nom. inval.)]|nr:4HBT domain-containing protein [Mycena kentingensis (nom. inval.)]